MNPAAIPLTKIHVPLFSLATDVCLGKEWQLMVILREYSTVGRYQRQQSHSMLTLPSTPPIDDVFIFVAIEVACQLHYNNLPS